MNRTPYYLSKANSPQVAAQRAMLPIWVPPSSPLEVDFLVDAATRVVENVFEWDDCYCEDFHDTEPGGQCCFCELAEALDDYVRKAHEDAS